jgi:hypothetical protein
VRRNIEAGQHQLALLLPGEARGSEAFDLWRREVRAR